MPEYAKAWGYPMPEALALGEVWLAKALYPQRFQDVDLDKMVNDYYQNSTALLTNPTMQPDSYLKFSLA